MEKKKERITSEPAITCSLRGKGGNSYFRLTTVTDHYTTALASFPGRAEPVSPQPVAGSDWLKKIVHSGIGFFVVIFYLTFVYVGNEMHGKNHI